MPADEPLFRRPFRSDPLLRLWCFGVCIAIVVASVKYIEWGKPYNPDRAAEFFWLLFWAALILWLLALLPAAGRRAVARGTNWSSRAGGRPHRDRSGLRHADNVTNHAAAASREPRPTPVRGQPTATHQSSGTAPPRWDGTSALDETPVGDLQLLTVAQRRVREGEPLRIDWHVPQADAVLIDGRKCDATGAYEVVVEKSRDVLFQAFRGDRLIRSVCVPVTVHAEEVVPDWLGAPAAALDRVVRDRRTHRSIPTVDEGASRV